MEFIYLGIIIENCDKAHQFQYVNLTEEKTYPLKHISHLLIVGLQILYSHYLIYTIFL